LAEAERKPELKPAVAATAEVGQYCPTCGAKLKDRGCKLKCEQCGFFLSCSDFY
jgi:hypothetical protein